MLKQAKDAKTSVVGCCIGSVNCARGDDSVGAVGQISEIHRPPTSTLNIFGLEEKIGVKEMSAVYNGSR